MRCYGAPGNFPFCQREAAFKKQLWPRLIKEHQNMIKSIEIAKWGERRGRFLRRPTAAIYSTVGDIWAFGIQFHADCGEAKYPPFLTSPSPLSLCLPAIKLYKLLYRSNSDLDSYELSIACINGI